MTKYCKYCGERKEISFFAKCTRDGYQSKCKLCSNKISSAWNKSHLPLLAKRAKEKRAINPELARQKEKELRQANPSAHRTRHKKWRDAHLNQERERLRVLQKEKPEIFLAQKQKRRARKIGTGGFVSHRELVNLRESYLNKCAYCNNSFECFDHVTPLSRGGKHSIENLVPACTTCNSSKHAKSLLRFLMERV